MAVAKALSDENPAKELRWASFLAGGNAPRVATAKAAAKKKLKL
jgi:hypothetical protein